MGNYISLLTGSNPADEELSLEDAYKLLKNEEKLDIIENLSNNTRDKIVSTKTGIITDTINDKYVIDGCYVFTKSETDFTVGSTVSYNLFNSDNTFKVTNVTIVNNEWDLTENSDSIWNNRILISQVEKRIERKLFLSNTDIALNLDEVPLEFLPIVGDWLELDVKCIVNENSLDLSGKIIEINRILPVRLHIKTGKITSWKLNEEVGTINNKIFFYKSALSMGYIPVLGDKVVAEIIESDQNRCSWRAIKILPESMSKKYKTLSNELDCENNYPGLEIGEVNLIFEKLGVTKKFTIDITNSTEEIFNLCKTEFMDNTTQCTVLDNKANTDILPHTTHQIQCECISRKVGQNKEFFSLHFNNVTLIKSASIVVTINKTNQTIPYEYKPKLNLHNESTNELIRGQKIGSSRFTAAQIPSYLVPQRLIDVVTKSDDVQSHIKVIKPSLFSNLTHLNYEDKFHTLLHLDEIANLVAIRSYDEDRACFIRNAEFLMLEIDNLSERRPSLVIGDKIIATDPSNQKGLDYEGFIYKVAAKHVYIKFNLLFHDNYNGEDYSVRVVPGRNSYRRLHHAVNLAVRNLGQELLFPNRVSVKEPQVMFVWEKDTVNSPKQKLREVMNKIKESKNKLNENEVKLEWFNKKLNPKQKNAVRHVLWGEARPLPYIIFGPPGTGKTVTIIETVLQIVRLIPSSRLLVTAPSNSAADLIALRLIESGVLMPGDLVRIVSYNYALSDMIPVKLVPYCATASHAKEDTGINDVFSRGIQFECSQSTLGRHRITVATCSASGQFFNMGLPKGHFTHIIVDEAAQAGEPDVMIPMAFLDKNSGQVVLAGDPMQLGPVVLCKIASECGLSESYLERLINRFPYVRDPDGFSDTSGFDPRLVTKLLYNYRALPDILNLYNNLFYNDELIPTIDDENSNEGNLLSTLQEILPRKKDGKLAQIIFHGVDGVNYQTADSPSWFNPHEAAQLFFYVNEFYRLGVKSTNIGIITPYIKQVKEIRSLLTEAEFDVPRTGTIEEFQGQEFDIILLSTVRSCEEYLSSDIFHSIGFVASPKRLNVAISRAKSLLIIIGNPKLLRHDIHWRSVVKYCMDRGSYIGCEF